MELKQQLIDDIEMLPENALKAASVMIRELRLLTENMTMITADENIQKYDISWKL